MLGLYSQHSSPSFADFRFSCPSAWIALSPSHQTPDSYQSLSRDNPSVDLKLFLVTPITAFSALVSCELCQGREGLYHTNLSDGWMGTHLNEWMKEWMNAFISSLSGSSNWLFPLSTATMQPLYRFCGCLLLTPGPCLQSAKRMLLLWQVGCRVEKLECFHLFTFTTCHRN